MATGRRTITPRGGVYWLLNAEWSALKPYMHSNNKWTQIVFICICTCTYIHTYLYNPFIHIHMYKHMYIKLYKNNSQRKEAINLRAEG